MPYLTSRGLNKYKEATWKLGQADKTPHTHTQEVAGVNIREGTHRETEVLRFQSRAQQAGLTSMGGAYQGGWSLPARLM